MQLLERDSSLTRLEELVEEASQGTGHVALVRGEAGIGKTTLINHFVATLDDVHVLWGACDDLVAGRPLGPLWDIAFDEPEIESALQDDDRMAAFRAVLDLLSRELRPTVLVIEDVHWADVATLDLIKYVGRRITGTHGLVVLTYRDGEVGGDHPLRVALGDLPYGVVERIALEPLSLESIETLAAGRHDPSAVLELTGGNPFFVSEALEAVGDEVPVSIAEAVNTRVRRLSGDARGLVELASVVPSKVELTLITEILGDASKAIAECEEAGILEVAGDALRFRHELARRAIESDLPEIMRRTLNSRCLQAGQTLSLDIARLGHHALEAGDEAAILEHIPAAARRASALESHQEAVRYLRALEPFLDQMSKEELADHYDLWAYEEYLWDVAREDLIARAVELRRSLGDPSKLGRSLLSASRVSWVASNRKLAIAYAQEAVLVLEEAGGEDLAMAYSTLSQLGMLANDFDQAISYGTKALDIVGDEPTRARAHALNNIGSVLMWEQFDEGLARLEESLAVAERLQLPHDQARACVNLAWTFLWRRELEQAETWIRTGQEIMARAEMPTFESYAVTMDALLHLYRGDWEMADELTRDVMGRSATLATSQATTVMVAAKLAVRTGSPEAASLVDETIELAMKADEMQRTAPAAEVAAEYHWLGGEVSQSRLDWCVREMETASRLRAPWNVVELATWLTLAGVIDEPPQGTPEPALLIAAGQWRGAAQWWDRRGLPYETAVSLSLGDPEARIEALEILDRLGAQPLATRLRSELQEAGVKGVPRRPQRTTRENPLGLTARQADVLDLLAEDLTNAEIADRLFISTRTVDHHVSAILAKLGASNRAEAAAKARETVG